MKIPKFGLSNCVVTIFVSPLIIWLIWLGIATALAEPHLSIHNFPPSDLVIQQDDINQSITFNFYVSNDGDKATYAFIYVMESGKENKVQYSGPRAFGPGMVIKYCGTETAIGKQLFFFAGETKEITVIISAPKEVTSKEIVVGIDYDDKSKNITSNMAVVRWG